MARREKSSYWMDGTVSWKRVGVAVLTISGVALLTGIVLIRRARNPQIEEPPLRSVQYRTRTSLGGTVYDATGEAKPGADVYLALWAGKSGHFLEGQTVAGSTGAYQFTDLEGIHPDNPLYTAGLFHQHYCVFAHVRGQGFGYVEFVPTHDTADAAVRLSPEHRLWGTVTDATGDPIERATIDLREVKVLDATGTALSLWLDFRTRDPLPPFLRNTTDAGGGFVLPGLPGGEGIRLEVRASGYFGEDVRDVSTEEPISITLERALALVVRVVPERSNSVLDPAATLNIRRAEVVVRRAVRPNNDGLFRARLKTGHYMITLDSKKFESDPVNVHLTLESSGRPVVIEAREIPEEGT